ncbi:MAG: putative sugar O-methyltransferase [Pedosphaera sp.]|nr:putative sugar O-methyltransferase [Pedosphaera sp.]
MPSHAKAATAGAESIRAELKAMFAELQRGRPEVQPSKYWVELNRSDESALVAVGFENFKRTVARHYFTWTQIWPWDSQLRFLMSQLPLTATCANTLRTFRPLKHQHMPISQSLAVNFLSQMIWDYALKTCPFLEKLAEPEIGNPPRVLRNGRLISQDLANSALEAQSILAGLPVTLWPSPASTPLTGDQIGEGGGREGGEGHKTTGVKRVGELGAGYGRNAHVLLSLLPGVRYVVIDIPPALYVAQRYLSAVFPARKVFAWRPFQSYAGIKDEFEQADLAFLLPSQIELLPDGLFDLFVNVSSLHEMRLEQIKYYFTQIRRLVRDQGWFYLKEWKVSHIPFENIVIRQEEYPLSEWQILF